MEEKNHHEHEADELNGAYKGKTKLSLENYFSILASGNYNVLTVRELNQILSIHGFKQLNRVKKLELVEAVSTMELKDFSRSTLAECIQPAPMSLTDVIKDLTQLNWQTCPVVSVKSINSTHDNNMASSTCDPKASVDPAGLESEKKKRKTAPASKKKSGGQSGRSGAEQASSVVSARSIDSTQYNNMASSTCDLKASEDPAGLKSEKKKRKTEPASKKKSGGQNGRSGAEQASSVVSARSVDSTQYNNVDSTCYPMATYVLGLEAEPASKQKSCDQSGKYACSGGDNSGDLKEYGAMIGTPCSSSTMAEKETKPANKRQRKVNRKSQEYLSSGGMPKLCQELGIFS